MLGEMMGAPPGKDSLADAAWRFLASPDALELNEALSESLAGAVHTERKEDVMRLLAKLLTAQGLQYLRAFAHELWLHAGSPCATTPGQPTASTTVDWPEVLARLAAGEAVDPSLYYFRTAMRFQTGAPELAWMNRIIGIGTGQRPPSGPRYDVYAVR